MTTNNQTVEITYAKSDVTIMSLELRPVKPKDAAGNTLTGPDGTVTKWCLHGVEQWTADGNSKFWWYKPTLKTIIESKAQGIYVRFHSDDSISYRIDGLPYYWSPPVPAQPCVGTWSWTDYCDDSYDDHMWKPYCSGAHCNYCGDYLPPPPTIAHGKSPSLAPSSA